VAGKHDARKLRDHRFASRGEHHRDSHHTLVPRNIVVRSTAIHVNVMEALRDSGGLNAGIPLEIASMVSSVAIRKCSQQQEESQRLFVITLSELEFVSLDWRRPP
jgi:hypothetical protein